MTRTTATELRLSGQLICADMAEVAAIKAHLPEHIRLTLAEAGCLSFRVWQTADPLIWGVEERFADAAALQHHQQRTRASLWWAQTATITRRYQISEIAPDTAADKATDKAADQC